jgi:hypothetical protein
MQAIVAQYPDAKGIRDWTWELGAWTVKRSARMKRKMGCCDWRRRQIRLADYLFKPENAEALEDTFLHEVAHLLAGHREGHGPLWKQWAVRLGANPSPCGTVESGQEQPWSHDPEVSEPHSTEDIMARFSISAKGQPDIAFKVAELASLFDISAKVLPQFSSVGGAVEYGADVVVFHSEAVALRLFDLLQNELGLGCAWWDSEEHTGCSEKHPRVLPEAPSGPPTDMVEGRHHRGWAI